MIVTEKRVAHKDDYLRALAKYGHLTIRQMTRLYHYTQKWGNEKEIGKRLADLLAQGYIEFDKKPRDEDPWGQLRRLYKLADKGKRYCDRELNVDWYPVQTLTEAQNVDHRIEQNDFFIAAELLARENPNIELDTVLIEHDLKQAKFVTHTASGRRLVVVPDGYVKFFYDNFPISIVLEVDRGTEEEKRWNLKVAGLVEWLRGPYQRQFGTSSAIIAVIVTRGHHGVETRERRANKLKNWTEHVLTEIQAENLSPVFHFAPLILNPETPEEYVTPEELFLEPRFAQPFKEGYVSLLTDE